MCEFISWVEKDTAKGGKKYLFLTYDRIFNTPRGEILRKEVDSYKSEDLYGHAAIRKYYQCRGGVGRECTDFSTPKNFPAVIVKAIKRGDMRGLAAPAELLSQPAWAEYEKIEQQARAEYEKIEQQAWAEYEKIEQQARAEYEKIGQPARAEYEKIRQSAWAEYEKIGQPARAEYEKIEQQAWAEYEKIKQPARAEYEKIRQPAWAEYEKIKQSVFWDLFANPENRNPLWR